MRIILKSDKMKKSPIF